jgi:hypothetical protein
MKEKSDSRKNFENLREILEQMKNKKTGYKYEGNIPASIREIMRISTRIFNYTEVVFENLEEIIIKDIVKDFGLDYEKKIRTIDIACGHCPIKEIYKCDGEPSNASTITKPKKFWVPSVIADVVNNSIRIYDTKEGVEIGAEIINQYLEKRSHPNEVLEEYI